MRLLCACCATAVLLLCSCFAVAAVQILGVALDEGLTPLEALVGERRGDDGAQQGL